MVTVALPSKMSNSSGKKNKNDTSTPSSVSANAKANQRWSFIQSDLSSAVDTWKELEKADCGPSPEEKQLSEIKSIITQLKEKLEQF
ncbi:MAG: hypothetical protein K0R29_633 [Pseudobdellovibrio sp.]|jgi:hypothetical protein|nr:hypothetical protein [Pseudobdellovibrio sp.]